MSQTIVVMGNPNEDMVSGVHDELVRRGRTVALVQSHDLPGTVRFGLSLGTAIDGFFTLADGRRIGFESVTSIYQRVGFFATETWDDYSPEETTYASTATLAGISVVLDNIDALVVNRPMYSGSNASKPYQIGLVEQHGFSVPSTLVTNRPEAACAFYEEHGGNVIYKSISYVRSIVRRMELEDLERLDTLRNCPVQLQACVEGRDIRVHVVGPDALFAHFIEADESDYRYDKQARIKAHVLPETVRRQCFAVAKALGFVLAGIDLRVTPQGQYYCFEVNPSPAFTWYEARTGQPITATLCDVLERADAQRPWP